MTLEDKMKELYKDICKQFEEYQKTCDDLYSDYYNLQQRINKAINILELSSQNKGICTRPETDTIQSALLVLKGEDK